MPFNFQQPVQEWRLRLLVFFSQPARSGSKDPKTTRGYTRPRLPSPVMYNLCIDSDNFLVVVGSICLTNMICIYYVYIFMYTLLSMYSIRHKRSSSYEACEPTKYIIHIRLTLFAHPKKCTFICHVYSHSRMCGENIY